MDSTIANLLLLIILGIVLLLSSFGTIWIAWLLVPIISGGGPYVPSRMSRVHEMIRVAKLTKEDVTVDLGSGDGRIVIAAAHTGAKGIGYEIHLGLVWLSRLKAYKAGVGDRTTFLCRSMWNADLSNVTVVFLYQIPYAMRSIGEKLKKELPPGARIISNAFEVTGWEPVYEKDGVRIYQKSLS